MPRRCISTSCTYAVIISIGGTCILYSVTHNLSVYVLVVVAANSVWCLGHCGRTAGAIVRRCCQPRWFHTIRSLAFLNLPFPY